MSQQATVNTPVNTVNTPAANNAKTAMLAANTVYSIAFLLDRIVANPTGFFKIVEKEAPKAGRAPAAKPTTSSVKYYKQQWDFGNGTKFVGNLKFNLVDNSPNADEIPETVHELTREDLLNGKVRMYRGIGNIDDPTDHRNSYDKGDGKNNSSGLFKVSLSTTDAGKLGQFMILLDVQWTAECERIKASTQLMRQKSINTLTSAFISQGEKEGMMKDAPTFSVKIPVNETYPAAFRSRAGQAKSTILDAATAYSRAGETNRRFLKAALETDDGTVIVDATNAWQFVEGGSKFVAESEFEFNDPNCSMFGFAMSLIATTPVIERRSGGFAPSGNNLLGNEDEYLAAINGTQSPAPVSAQPAATRAPVVQPTTTTTQQTTQQPTATQVAADADMAALLDAFK